MNIEEKRKQYRDYYYRRPRKPCPTCGVPILIQSTACRKHRTYPTGKEDYKWKGGAELARQRFFEKHHRYCKDCNKPIWPQSVYCPNCKYKHEPLRKGGRSLAHGYVIIRNRQHPRANKHGYVMEHILVWEQANGKPLPKNWIIHHLNGIKHDNRLRNLVALPNQKHCLVLQAKAKRIQELEASLNG